MHNSTNKTDFTTYNSITVEESANSVAIPLSLDLNTGFNGAMFRVQIELYNTIKKYLTMT